MKKELLIELLNRGISVTLAGSFSDGETSWNYEYWTKEDDKYRCSYDGEYSHYFEYSDLDYSFNSQEAIEIKTGDITWELGENCFFSNNTNDIVYYNIEADTFSIEKNHCGVEEYLDNGTIECLEDIINESI